MTIRVVLGLIDGGPSAEAAARAAVAVADIFGAHLQLLHVRPDPESLVPMIGEGMSGVMLDRLRQCPGLLMNPRQSAHQPRTR